MRSDLATYTMFTGIIMLTLFVVFFAPVG